MEWSSRNANGTLAYPNSQQYLPQSTSSTVPTISSHTTSAAPNSYSAIQTVTHSRNPILTGLLGADSAEQFFKLQQSLTKTPEQQTVQVSPEQYNNAYNLMKKMSIVANQSSTDNQTVSNYQIQVYPNPVLQTFQQEQGVRLVQQQTQPVPHMQQQQVQAVYLVQQQPGLHVQQQVSHVQQQQAQPVSHVQQQQAQPVSHVQQQQASHVQQQQAQPVSHVQQQQQAQPVQCYNNGYNIGNGQQSVQNSQSSGYTHKRTQKQMSNTYAAKRTSQNVPVTYRPPIQQPNNINSTSNRSSAPCVTSYKTLNDRNVLVSTSNYQNGQNIDNRIGSNYHTSHTNTLQPQQVVNDNVQNPQRQTMQNLQSGFGNNSSNLLPTATIGQTPLLYTQSNTNTSNAYSTSVNQRFSNPNQNFSSQNAQQPIQSSALPQDQHSMALLPSASSRNVPPEQRPNMQDILALLKVYRDVKLKYLLLNRENNLFRQKMQSGSSDNSVRPPLISSLSNATVPTNDFMSRQVISQNSTLECQPLSNTTNLVQNPPLYDNSLNVPVQDSAQPSSSFPSQIYQNNDNVHNQTNYTGFDGGQMKFGSRANSTDKALSSETLRAQDTLVTSAVPKPINDQYLSNGHSSNVNLSQDVLHRTSAQNLVQTATASSESCSPSHTTNTGNFYSNKPLSSSSREAINASLPLWRSAPQSSVPNKSGYSEPNGFNSANRIVEISSSSVNESTSVNLTQKFEHSGQIGSKGVAVVSPLVKIKELVKDFKKLPKVVPLIKDLASDHANKVEENVQLKKLFPELDSIDAAATMKNLYANSPRSSMVLSLPCSVEVSSNCDDQDSPKNLETVDDFQISGICTLVEGNSLYDSSVAMMFEGSLQTPLGSQLTQAELKDDSNLQCSQEDINLRSASQATSSVSSTSPTTETISVKTGPQGDIDPLMQTEDNQHGSVFCLEKQSEHSLLDLESNTSADQLSELLTEFPFGIKNYMAENELKSPGISFETFADKSKMLVPILCDGEIDCTIEDTWRENAMDTANIETPSQNTEFTIKQSIVEEEPELPTDEEDSAQLEDDDIFEISDSPDANLCITLLDQDEIPKIFPDESAKPIVESEESAAERFAKPPVVDAAVHSIKEKTCNETSSVPENELFCCLFSWLTHTNGNAPKCNCKITEFGKTEDLTSKLSQHPAVRKTKTSRAVLDSTTGALCSSSDGLKPFRNLCKIDKIPPLAKRPKLEPIDNSLKSKLGPQHIKSKPDLSGKYLKDKPQKELSKNNTPVNEKIFQSKTLLKDLSPKKTNDPSPGYNSKVDVSQKIEKLIIKTDFLKYKHSLKMKHKYKERKTSHVEGSAGSVKKIKKHTDESGKTGMDQRIGSKTNKEKCKLPAGIVQQSEKHKTKHKSAKSHSHSQDPSPSKHRGRAKSIPQSHFEKVKKVPTVQEYLERKRELCNKKSGHTVDQKDEPVDRERVVEQPAMEKNGNLRAKLSKLLAPVKINLKTKTVESETNTPNQKNRPRSGGGHESLHKRHTSSSSSHGKGSFMSKGQDHKSTSSKAKIYLSPLDGSSRASCEGISVSKLQIRCSPEKPEYSERRQSLDDSRHSKPSKSEIKNREAPKMLEFKLCPEFVHSPSTKEKKKEPKPAKESNIIEGIKSKKEAWCSGGPVKKIRTESGSENQGRSSPSQSTSSFKSTPKNSPRPMQDSQTTFNVFKQKYHEQRSKSLDSGL